MGDQNTLFASASKEDVQAAENNAVEKIKTYSAAAKDSAVDKAGLKAAADEAIKAMGDWIDVLYEINGQLTSASSLLSDMLLGKYDPSKKGH